MYSIQKLLLFLILFSVSFNIQAQKRNIKTNKVQAKEYNFNPDYPDFYYGDHKVFLEAVWYKRMADISVYKNRYIISFSGMSSKGYVSNNWGFNKLEDFLYYKDLIENKKYFKILLKPTNDGLISEITILMHPKRKIPKN